MNRVNGFRFNPCELAGSMGDFGTLLHLAIGYITVCKMNPAGLLVLMGLAKSGWSLATARNSIYKAWRQDRMIEEPHDHRGSGRKWEMSIEDDTK